MKYAYLKERLLYLCERYYNHDESIVSDYEFDRLKDLYEKSSGEKFEFVGSPVLEKLQKYNHNQKMLSLEKVNSFSQLKKWINNKGKTELIVQWKLDGVSLDLRYEYGVLNKVLTRGNGTQGEDVTHVAYSMKTIPKFVEKWFDVSTVHVRGEGIISKENFARLKESNPEYASARNLASGSIRLKNEIESKLRCLEFIAYECFKTFKNTSSIIDQTKELNECKFKTLGTKSFFYSFDGDFDKIQKYIEELELERKIYKHETDGVVIKINCPEHMKILGETDHHPKYFVAYKFKSESAITTLRDIIWNTSTTGRVNPVAIFDPIEIGGVTISKASLHNLDIIKEFELTYDCEIEIERANDVIPYVKSVIKHNTGAVIKTIKKCPSCNKRLARLDQWLFCVNPDCLGKNKSKIITFLKLLELKGVGESYAQLIAEELIETKKPYYSILEWRLKDFQLITGSKRISEKIISQLQNSLDNFTPDKAMACLFIDGVSRSVSKKILEHYSYDEIEKLTSEKLQKVNSVGKILSGKICSAFKDNIVLDAYEYFKDFIVIKEESESSTNHLKDLKFCITGKLPVMRQQVEKIIEDNGGKIVTAISSKTDYLICGEKSGSKLQVAQKLGIKVISFSDFKLMLENF